MADKRNVFDELMEGVTAMKAHRAGKITLRTYKVEPRALPEVKPKMIKQVRAHFHCSRSVFARRLFTNERTLEKWNKGEPSPTPRRPRYCYWQPDFRTHSSVWSSWQGRNVRRRFSPHLAAVVASCAGRSVQLFLHQNRQRRHDSFRAFAESCPN